LKTIHSDNFLSHTEISDHLTQDFSLKILSETDSTNKQLKLLAEQGAPEWSVLLAEHQTAGKGRLDRSFLSPRGSGIYMSFLLRPAKSAPSLPVTESVLLTVCAASAVYEAVKSVTDKETAIKWVNDLYYKNKKVCGILTEGALTTDGSSLEYAIVGIGLNVIDPNFDGELGNIATGLYQDGECKSIGAVRNNLVSEILNRFRYFYETQLADKDAVRAFIDVYREKMFLYGKTVNVFAGDTPKEATVISLNSDCSLNIRYSDGKEQALSYGEVQIKLK